MPCVGSAIVFQYSETNVMHFLFNLFRIKGLYKFRALPAHPQEYSSSQLFFENNKLIYSLLACGTPRRDKLILGVRLEECGIQRVVF
jgi:hypothetical protein